MELLSAEQAAGRLGISLARVKQLLAEGKIKAQKVGKQWIIQESALNGVTIYGKAGRPPKAETTGEKAATKRSSKKSITK
jgi:excisionase family DNA binding protein